MRKSKNYSGRRRQRRALWIAVASVGLLAVAAAAVLQLARGSSAATRQITGGALVTNPQPAPDFTLADQFGRPQTLSSFRGKPVALTYIYTNCPDVCPLISAHMHQAYQMLGDRAKQVQLVAVTVDPERDNVTQIHDFSDKLGLTNEWVFLTGSRQQLQDVWARYGIDATQQSAHHGAAADGSSSEADLIEHAAPVYLIDKQGQMRAMLPVDVTPETLSADLRVLLAERTPAAATGS